MSASVLTAALFVTAWFVADTRTSHAATMFPSTPHCVFNLLQTRVWVYGAVVDDGLAPLQGVTVTLEVTGFNPQGAVTDGDGYFEDLVPEVWGSGKKTVKATFTKSGYTTEVRNFVCDPGDCDGDPQGCPVDSVGGVLLPITVDTPDSAAPARNQPPASLVAAAAVAGAIGVLLAALIRQRRGPRER